MATYWLAIDTVYTSYEELKHRKVIAQGWTHLGDLRTMVPLVGRKPSRKVFERTIEELQRVQNIQPDQAARVMWDLLGLKTGDVIVGIEGTTVRGICEMKFDGASSYRYLNFDTYEYAQTVGFPVEWVDWNSTRFGFTPTPPAKSVQGIKGLKQDSQKVLAIWQGIKKA